MVTPGVYAGWNVTVESVFNAADEVADLAGVIVARRGDQERRFSPSYTVPELVLQLTSTDPELSIRDLDRAIKDAKEAG